MKCPRCQQDSPSHALFCLQCGTPINRANESGPPGASYADLQRELDEALEQQQATSEVLKVISRSTFELQPVLDLLIERATRLCDADRGFIFRREGDLYRGAADYNDRPEHRDYINRNPIAVGRTTVVGRVALERRTIHFPDILADPEYRWPEALRLAPFRTVLGVPMLREGQPIGVMFIWREEVRPFTDKQIELVTTFADHAVIAIENERLFNETKEALERQTATAEVLRVIASSPTDLRPVLNTVAQRAARLCNANDAIIFQVDDEALRLVVRWGSVPTVLDADTRIPISRASVPARALVDRAIVHIHDITTQFDEFSQSQQYMSRTGVRTVLAVPLLRDDEAIGVILIRRLEVRPFTDTQIQLLQTFSDQAVIAIENVRLFTELREKNQALTSANAQVTEALEQQTATSEILRVISRSPTDLDPVLDAVARNAARLCEVDDLAIIRADGDGFTILFSLGPDHASRGRQLPWAPTATGRAIREGRTVHIPDILADPAYEARPQYQAFGWRTALAVPLIREGVAIGTITARRPEVRPFTDTQINLLETFADQAVIAIENARLFDELRSRTAALTRSVDELTALGEISRALSSTLDLDAVLQTIVTRASQLAGTDACSVFEYDEASEAFHLRATNNLDAEVVALARRTPTRKGEGVQGRMVVTRQPVQVPDIAQEDAYRGPLRDILLRTGTRAVLAIPMLRDDQLIGGLTVNKKTPGEFSPEVIELLRTFATQSALAIQNARLFRELADKSRQLEAASQHKSEFLASMSHELRTPLNAIIGFSEVLAEGMFGEVNEKQTEYLSDILESGRHLLSLINDILDLSKIEAGRMELELTDFDLGQAINNALILIRERAGRRGIALHQAVDQGLGLIRGDERKIKQVLLNLLSNALKFTPEGGRVEVRAGIGDELAEVSVTDTGVGIAPEDQESVFEEFRQVGTTAKHVEGTGLGLALSRKFIQLHGGRIWVKSQVGVGSTFTFTIPSPSGK